MFKGGCLSIRYARIKDIRAPVLKEARRLMCQPQLPRIKFEVTRQRALRVCKVCGRAGSFCCLPQLFDH